jgi:hypothetical protein
MDKVGKEGVITVEEAKGLETELDVVEGMQFDRGYVSPYFITNAEKMIAEMDQPYILILEKKLSQLQPMLPLLEAVVQSGRPLVIIADIHEDGSTLYPGTGAVEETGKGAARGTKLNLPLASGSTDADFDRVWPQVMAHLQRFEPQFIILQCGADSIAGDPLTHLGLSPASHARAATELAALAQSLGHGRLLALGGGGYNRSNLAAAWNAVVEALLSP